MHLRKYNRNSDFREPNKPQPGRTHCSCSCFPHLMWELAEERAPNHCFSHVSQVEAVDIHEFLFSFLPFSLTLQIYEESKMNLEQERPFVCSAPGCSQVSVGGPLLCLQGTQCLPTGRHLSLGHHACCWLSFYTEIFSPPLPPPPSSSFSTLNSLNYFPPSLCDTLVLAISPP